MSVEEDGSKEIPIRFSGGVRYTVPCTVSPDKIEKWLKIRFRVGDVMTGRKVVLYLDGDPVLTKKRRVMAPGEMEELVLMKKHLENHPDLSSLEIRIEEDAG